MTNLAPGIHAGLDFRTYLDIDACSSSRMKALGRSPAYCLHQLTAPRTSSAAMTVGSLVDALWFEPETVADRFAVKDFDARTKVGKARRDELAIAGIEVLSEADYDRALVIFEKVMRHPWVQDLEIEAVQETILWNDLETGLLCKARPDFRAKGRILGDLKVSREAIQGNYERKCVGLWHPQQLAWYAGGFAEHDVETIERWIVAVHPEPPHEVTAYQMSPELCKWADDAVYARFQVYADCKKSGLWPDGDTTVHVALPDWAMPAEVITEDD